MDYFLKVVWYSSAADEYLQDKGINQWELSFENLPQWNNKMTDLCKTDPQNVSSRNTN